MNGESEAASISSASPFKQNRHSVPMYNNKPINQKEMLVLIDDSLPYQFLEDEEIPNKPVKQIKEIKQNDQDGFSNANPFAYQRSPTNDYQQQAGAYPNQSQYGSSQCIGGGGYYATGMQMQKNQPTVGNNDWQQ